MQIIVKYNQNESDSQRILKTQGGQDNMSALPHQSVNVWPPCQVLHVKHLMQPSDGFPYFYCSTAQ